MSGDPRLFRDLIAAFDRHGLCYCILAGYDGYPGVVASDVDFMVLPADAARVPAILADAAASSGARLIQCVAHETTAAWFVIAHNDSPSLSFIQPDLSTDYRRHGRLWLAAGDVVKRRRRHPEGFWVPSAADAFIYYLIKKLDKGALFRAQAEEITRRFHEDPDAAASLLQRHFDARSAELIERAMRSGDAKSLTESFGTLRRQLHHHKRAEAPLLRLRQLAADALRIADRLRRPTGLSIAFLGPDGCGKSSVIERLQSELSDAFRRVEYQHLRPRPCAARGAPAHVAVVDPHGRARRSVSGSALHFWLRYLSGTIRWTYPRMVSSTLVIFDRYYHDLIADPCRYRYGAPLSWARLLGRAVPQPDLVFILDAPPEVIQARKQEVPFAESARQRAAYLALVPHLRAAHVIDAAQPLNQVIADVRGIVLTRLEARAAGRLELTVLTHGAGE
jgi:thymidylate kinase